MSLTSHRCCARLKILKQAWIFSVSHIITLSGLCIHRKAINKNKPLSSGFLFYHGLDATSTPVPGGQSHHKYPTCALVPGGHYSE